MCGNMDYILHVGSVFTTGLAIPAGPQSLSGEMLWAFCLVADLASRAVPENSNLFFVKDSP